MSGRARRVFSYFHACLLYIMSYFPGLPSLSGEILSYFIMIPAKHPVYSSLGLHLANILMGEKTFMIFDFSFKAIAIFICYLPGNNKESCYRVQMKESEKKIKLCHCKQWTNHERQQGGNKEQKIIRHIENR